MASIETDSKVSIISNALILCGERPLNALTDDRYGAQVGANLFDQLYQNELQSNPWRFAMNKKALSRLVNAPLNQWQFAYQLPSDMLLPMYVYPKVDYEIYGKHLYTDAASVEFDYLFKPNISDCPSYFTVLMTYALARDMIKPITESDTARDEMKKQYNTQRGIALFADAQGRPPKPIQDSPFTDNRAG